MRFRTAGLRMMFRVKMVLHCCAMSGNEEIVRGCYGLKKWLEIRAAPIISCQRPNTRGAPLLEAPYASRQGSS